MPRAKRQSFLQKFVATGDAQRAAAEAGYAQPRSAGYKILATPSGAADVARLQLDRLTNEVLPLAVDTLITCMRATAAPWAAKNQAAKIGLEYSVGRSDNGGGGKEEHEMTAGELDARILELEARKINLARPIEATILEDQAAGVFE